MTDQARHEQSTQSADRQAGDGLREALALAYDAGYRAKTYGFEDDKPAEIKAILAEIPKYVAAPELLAECKYALANMRGSSGCHQRLRHVIDKAEGKE